MAPFPVSQNRARLDAWRKTLGDDVVYSPCTPIEYPKEPLISRILRALNDHAELHPGKPAVIDAFNPNRYFTHRQIHDQALSIAAFLVSRNFGVGDRAATVLPNCIEFPVIHLGVWSAGGVFTGASPDFKHYETVHQLRDSGASVVFVPERVLEKLLKAVDECPEVKTIVCIRSSSSPLPNNVIDFNEALEFHQINEIVPVEMDSPCIVPYSSGTTGLQKGVIHSHRTFHCYIEIIRSHFLHEVYPLLGVTEVDWYQDQTAHLIPVDLGHTQKGIHFVEEVAVTRFVFLKLKQTVAARSPTPKLRDTRKAAMESDCQIISSGCYHALAFILLNWCMLTGAPAVLMERLDETIFPQLVAQYKPRYLIVLPSIFIHLAKDERGRAAPLESLQLIMCGGSPVSQDISDEFRKHHPNVKYIMQAYGMTEILLSHLPLLLQEGVTASSGVVVSGYAQRIVDPITHKSCKLGESGEILVKGPGLTVGYLNKPEATKLLFDDEGIYIVDRLKELIKVNYKNNVLQVSPAELEGILLSSPSIKELAIVGVPQNDGCELVRAYVVKADEELKAKDVEQIVADKLMPSKRITGGVVFVDAMPRSATGKILRRELREKY